MGWADEHISALQSGGEVSFRPVGRSMEPLVMSGQMVMVVPVGQDMPVTPSMLKVDDIVLCEVNGSQYLHLVKQCRLFDSKHEFLIGNNKGHNNGWTHESKVYGKVAHIGRRR